MSAEEPYVNGTTQPVHEPLNTQPQTPPEIVTDHEEEKPTLSHSLAGDDHEEKGAAQLAHGQTEVKDLGWNEHPTDVPMPLVGGLPNEELWTLVRRFNKVGTTVHWAYLQADNRSKCIM